MRLRGYVLSMMAAMFVSVCVAETKVGIIGLDTSHTIAFTEMMNVKKADFAAGFRVTHAYKWGSRDIISSTNRYAKYTEKMIGMGVEIVPSIAELLKKVDVVCLETCDGRPHLEQAREVFASGKRVFIDKPITADLKDAVALVALGKQMKAQWFSSSALRFSKNVIAARKGAFGKIKGADYSAPSPFEEQGTHSDYYWYGIHGFEPLMTVMGTGVEKVWCARTPDTDVITGLWKDGRVGVLRANRKSWEYGGVAIAAKPVNGSPFIPLTGYEGYEPLLREIIAFFKTGEVPVTPDETLELFAFMEAAAVSARHGGAEVTISEVLGEAK